MDNRDTNLKSNLITVTIGFSMLLSIGVGGYMMIEGWGWLDALYMTIISFSTVGFQEVSSLGKFGRIFTMFIILFGMIFIAMLSASVTSLFVRNELLSVRKKQKMQKSIQNLKGHTILCGAGDTGSAIIKEYQESKKPLVVIDTKSEILEYLKEQYPGILFIDGDATKDEVLIEANIKNARGLITALSLDADNLFVVISAKALNPAMKIISRAVDPHTESKLYKSGANYVISPNLVEGMRMASVMLRPTVVSFLDVMMRGDEFSFRLEEINVPKGASLHGKALIDARIPQLTGLIVIAVKKNDNSGIIFNPSSATVLHEHDTLIVLGDFEKIQKLETLLKA
ncbi:MAG: TrkA family potassium uptake protein [Calditrichaceae bacterium]